MMKRGVRFVLLIAVAALLTQCQKSFVLSGETAPDFEGERVLLLRFDRDRVVDTLESTVRERSFSFTGSEYDRDKSMIRIANRTIPVFLEPGRIGVSVDSVNRVWGTPLNDSLQGYFDSCAFYARKMDAFLPSVDGPRTSVSFRKDSPLAKVYAEQGRFSFYFMKRNLSNPVGEYCFLENLRPSAFGFFAEQIYLGKDTVFQHLYSLADSALKNHPAVTAYLQRQQEAKELQRQRDLLKSRPFEDFPLQTTDGEPRNLSDYVGRSELLLIDFWASWCTPCIGSVPALKEIYEKYHDRGLNIVSISIDTQKSKWVEMANKLKMPWPQLSDLKGKESDLGRAYLLKGVPYLVLLDRKGNVLTMVQTADFLDVILGSYLTKE